MKQNNSPRNGRPGALRPVLEMLEQRLLLDSGLGDILANQPAVIELSFPGDWSQRTDIISSDHYHLLSDSESLELNHAETNQTQAKDATQPSITLEDLLPNFAHVIGPLPDANDDLMSRTPLAAQPSNNMAENTFLEVQPPDYDTQNLSPDSPIEQTAGTDFNRAVEPELSKEQAWSPLDAPLVIQMPAPPAGLLAAELPSRLPDSTIGKPLIAHSRSAAIAVASTSAQAGDVLKQSVTSLRNNDVLPNASKSNSVAEEIQPNASNRLEDMAIAKSLRWLSPSTVREISHEAYFDPSASLKRSPMAWSTFDSASATRKHAALENESRELRADSKDKTTPKPTYNSEHASRTILLTPPWGIFSALVTNAVITTQLASELLFDEGATLQVGGPKDSELEPEVMANFLRGELNSPITVSQSNSLPGDPTSPSWSELLVLIVAGLLLPAYVQEPRVRNV